MPVRLAKPAVVAVNGGLDQTRPTLIVSSRHQELAKAGMCPPRGRWDSSSSGGGRSFRTFTQVARDGLSH
jgi:hypothetical protein